MVAVTEALFSNAADLGGFSETADVGGRSVSTEYVEEEGFTTLSGALIDCEYSEPARFGFHGLAVAGVGKASSGIGDAWRCAWG